MAYTPGGGVARALPGVQKGLSFTWQRATLWKWRNSFS
jgi:hypothetical protein